MSEKTYSDAGKGSDWRDGMNYKRYWNSPIWDNLKKNKEKKDEERDENKEMGSVPKSERKSAEGE